MDPLGIRDRFRKAAVTSLDLRLLHMNGAEGPRVVADAFQLPFPPRSFDCALCSSFLHHFPDGRVVEPITELRQLARRSLILLDLERCSLAYRFLSITKGIFQGSELTVYDGLGRFGVPRVAVETVA